MLLVLALFICASLGLTELEAEGLVRYGFCTRASATRDCSWTANCANVFCNTGSTGNGNIAIIVYRPKNTDPVSFRGISPDFTRYFENVSSLYINDTQVSPPVRWSLVNLASKMKRIDTLLVYSQPGGLYGTLPQRFASSNLGSLTVDGDLEGTIPSTLFETVSDPNIQLYNHRLVGTIPSSILTGSRTSIKLQSTNGNLVGQIPSTVSCQLSSEYLTGIGGNGGFFCECSTTCTPNPASGANMCYDYTDPTITFDPCVSYPALPNCANTKLTMRYGTLCYDVCDMGCPVGTTCGVELVMGVPAFACVEVSIDTVTTPTTYSSNDSSNASPCVMLATLLSLVL
jgi:hypothetical protein